MLEKVVTGFANNRLSLCRPLVFDRVNLTIDNLTVLDTICCRIETLGKTVLMGANGAGKSLFLRLATGLLAPTGGTVSGMIDLSQQQLCQSMIFQKPILLRRSVFANVAFVLQHKVGKKDQLKARVMAALGSAGLEMRAEMQARKLSGGEQQRLALARALVVEPAVLFLDEATASLDPASTKIVEEMIIDADRSGIKIIHVTHDIKQARRLADDILFMHNGRLLLHQSAEDFFSKPGCDEAQAYLDGRLI